MKPPYSYTYQEMFTECESNRDESRFCNVCSSCSGPSQSNLSFDFSERETYPGYRHYRGGRYGECHFIVKED